MPQHKLPEVIQAILFIFHSPKQVKSGWGVGSVILPCPGKAGDVEMFGEQSGEAERTGSLMALLSCHPPMPCLWTCNYVK